MLLDSVAPSDDLATYICPSGFSYTITLLYQIQSRFKVSYSFQCWSFSETQQPQDQAKFEIRYECNCRAGVIGLSSDAFDSSWLEIFST